MLSSHILPFRPSFVPGALCMLAMFFGGAACRRHGGAPESPLVKVKAGTFWMGSDLDERAQAVEDLADSAPDSLRHGYHWIEQELPKQQKKTQGFEIMRLAVTQADYYRFVLETGHAEPYVSPEIWKKQETHIPYEALKAIFWQDGRPSRGHARHPITLVSQRDAAQYCAWWGRKHRGAGRLPTEEEWERAARGDKGQRYPWGNELQPALLNASESDLQRSTPVSAYVGGASPYGAVGMAGNVFEWTATPSDRLGFIVKGGAYALSGAMARAAARHGRPAAQKHPALGFRCVFVREGKSAAKAPPSTTR